MQCLMFRSRLYFYNVVFFFCVWILDIDQKESSDLLNQEGSKLDSASTFSELFFFESLLIKKLYTEKIEKKNSITYGTTIFGITEIYFLL